MIGQKVAQYRIVDKIGEGGMGEVYLAEDTTLKRHVALKVLPPRLAADPARLSRFRREAEVLAALDHPNIVTVYSVEHHDGVHFLTMSLVEGRTLDALIPPDGMPLRELFEVAIPIAEALAVAHDKGIVHRDLKPRNLMVGDDGRVRILDFGLAKLRSRPPSADSSTHLPTEITQEHGATLGTARYMSPEQVRGEDADPRSDVFSLGIVLYETATGRHPFPGDTPPEVMSAILRETPPAPGDLRADLPRHLDRIIRQCLEKDRARRFQSVLDIRNQLDQLVGELDSEPLPPAREPGDRPARSVPPGGRETGRTTSPRPSTRTFSTRPGWLIGGVLVAAVAIGLVTDVGGLRRGLFGGGGRAPIESIAVLPLSNVTADPADEPFVDGITEALITELAKISELNVRSRTSAFRFKGSDASLSEIAGELDVDGLVVGSVLRDGDRLRIDGQLIDARVDRTLWAQEYDRRIEDVLSLTQEVSRAIAAEVDVRLTASERERLADAEPVDAEAYEAYVQGRFHWNRFAPGDVERAEQYFERAMRLDPDFALPYEGLADVWGWRGYWGFLPASEVAPRVGELARKALELGPDVPQAHAIVARYELYMEWDLVTPAARFERALKLQPNDAMLHVYQALFLLTLGRRDEALAAILRAERLDPLNPVVDAVRGGILWDLGRDTEAVEELEKAGSILPSLLRLWGILAESGRFDEAFSAAVEYYETLGNVEVVEAMQRGWGEATGSGSGTAFTSAMAAGAATLAGQAEDSYVQPTQVARLYRLAGEADAAFRWLERGFEQHDPALVQLGHAEWRSLRSDPRLTDLARRIGLPAS